MNDTHGEQGKGWYGFDLDGTLAKYDGWKGIDHIGEPVKPMVELIRRMHDEGKVVKIVTARVAPRKLEDGTVGLESAMISSEDMRQFYNGKDDNPFENGYVTHVRLNAKEVVAYWDEVLEASDRVDIMTLTQERLGYEAPISYEDWLKVTKFIELGDQSVLYSDERVFLAKAKALTLKDVATKRLEQIKQTLKGYE